MYVSLSRASLSTCSTSFCWQHLSSQAGDNLDSRTRPTHAGYGREGGSAEYVREAGARLQPTAAYRACPSQPAGDWVHNVCGGDDTAIHDPCTPGRPAYEALKAILSTLPNMQANTHTGQFLHRPQAHRCPPLPAHLRSSMMETSALALSRAREWSSRPDSAASTVPCSASSSGPSTAADSCCDSARLSMLTADTWTLLLLSLKPASGSGARGQGSAYTSKDCVGGCAHSTGTHTAVRPAKTLLVIEVSSWHLTSIACKSTGQGRIFSHAKCKVLLGKRSQTCTFENGLWASATVQQHRQQLGVAAQQAAECGGRGGLHILRLGCVVHAHEAQQHVLRDSTAAAHIGRGTAAGRARSSKRRHALASSCDDGSLAQLRLELQSAGASYTSEVSAHEVWR